MTLNPEETASEKTLGKIAWALAHAVPLLFLYTVAQILGYVA